MAIEGIKSSDANKLLAKYGPLIGGKDLIQILGFKTSSAFRRAARMDLLTIHTFEIEGRRGRFALTEDVEVWLGTFRKKEV